MIQNDNNALKKTCAIIGGGASGCLCAYFLLKTGINVTIFDKSSPLRTLLPTGGGRCNLAHAEYDFKELAKNYPRGEKFLYSIFSKFSTYDTISVFSELGIDTYVQENNRIFPTSNSSKDVREKILANIKKAHFIREEVTDIKPLDCGFKITTNKSQYYFDNAVVAIGGHSECNFINNLGIKVIDPKPSLVGLNTKEDFSNISGIVLKNVYSKDIVLSDDILFTHFGISGPLTYTISSLKARDILPYKLTFDLYPNKLNLQEILDKHPHKEFKNIIGLLFPQNFANYITGKFAETKAHSIDGKTRDLILDKIHNFKINIISTNKGEETVTAGGIDLNEINPKTMESKKYPHLYFIGEILDIDGFCGGFNLQNAWSTAYIASQSILSN